MTPEGCELEAGAGTHETRVKTHSLQARQVSHADRICALTSVIIGRDRKDAPLWAAGRADTSRRLASAFAGL
jgi:hypothetical protein